MGDIVGDDNTIDTAMKYNDQYWGVMFCGCRVACAKGSAAVFMSRGAGKTGKHDAVTRCLARSRRVFALANQIAARVKLQHFSNAV
jgi:hypothetical protein